MNTTFEIDYERRFSGVSRLYGKDSLDKFRNSHICVIGLGGVGSWAVEALARTGIGNITLIDFDNISESNINRQSHAFSDSIGSSKVEEIALKIRNINIFCKVYKVEEFINEYNLQKLISKKKFNYLIDATDDTSAKVALINYCKKNEIPLITIGSAGGKLDPLKIKISDLSQTQQEPMLARVRKLLRSYYEFPRGKKPFGIDAVYSIEPIKYPNEKKNNPQNNFYGLNCNGYGSTVVVTSTFGLIAASYVLNKISNKTLV
tara:strand:+ start:519 stop:1301 length:783 start_codon:yes stop_codon:yes gene_type:complete